MGHELSADGLQPYPEKVKAIREMPAPTDKQSIQRLLGMTKVCPETRSLPRDFQRSRLLYASSAKTTAALEETKKILSTTPVRKYFDPSAKPTLQCDASMHVLGACLMQDGHPVAYSRSLTPTEVQYAQMEKELQVIVFGMEKFETYLYGRKVLVESDHKPMEAIFKKRLLNAPKRLQRMLLRLQCYDFEVSYKKETSLFMADPLGRAYLSLKEALKDQEDAKKGLQER